MLWIYTWLCIFSNFDVLLQVPTVHLNPLLLTLSQLIGQCGSNELLSMGAEPSLLAAGRMVSQCQESLLPEGNPKGHGNRLPGWWSKWPMNTASNCKRVITPQDASRPWKLEDRKELNFYISFFSTSHGLISGIASE